MENELPPENLKSLWQNQSVEPVQMSLEEIRKKAEIFQKRIRNRNFREYAASVVVFVAFGFYTWRFPDIRVGSAMIFAATIYMVYQLHTRGAAKTLPASMALDTCFEFHRRELERQRDLLRDIWKWYLLPFVPGLLAFIGVPLLHLSPDKWLRVLPFVVLCAGFYYAVWRLNQRAANKLQRQIDELDSMNA
jgi:Flp pilus assembly protein TadB